MQKILRNKAFNSISLLFIFLIFIELLFRVFANEPILGFSFIRALAFNFIIALFFGFITSHFKAKVMYTLNAIIIFAGSFYAFLQLGFNNFLGVYISINTSSQLGAVTSYILDFIKSMKTYYILMLLPSVVFVFIMIKLFEKLYDSFNKISLKRVSKYSNILTEVIVILLLTLTVGFSIYSLDDRFKDESQIISNKDLFWSVSNPGIAVKEFGVVPFAFVDFKTLVYVREDEGFIINDEANKVTNREIDDTAWEMLISQEKNATYNKLNKYFISKEITDYNDYTGLFEGKNLIVIEMESVNDVITNEKYFPNFHKMMENGWYFENNYSPRNSCATGNNEFSAMTGLYSIYNNCTSNIYVDNTYFQAIFNLFNNANYQTAGFHDYTETYYYRNIIEPNMGAQKYYNAKSLGISYYSKYGEWASDAEFMESYLNILDNNDPDKPFMSFLTTVTGHQPYNSSYYGNYYYDITKDTKYSSQLRHYISKLKITDDSFGILLKGLEKRGLLENTVIILFGDHYPYGIPLNILNEILDRDLSNYENEKVPFMIYSPSLEKAVFDTYTSYINIVPTVANLFNLNYDPRLYAGIDIFSSSYNNIVVFSDSSWKSNKAFYNAIDGSITYYNKEDDFRYTPEEIKAINTEIYNRVNTSALAIKNNYFAYLEKELSKIEIEKETTEENNE